MDSMSPTVGAALPKSAITLSDVNTREALSRVSSTVASMRPMHAPNAKLSR